MVLPFSFNVSIWQAGMLLNAPHTYLTSGLNSFTFTPGPATSGPVYVEITDAVSPAYPIYSYFSGTAQFTIDTITLDSIVLTPMNVVSQIASDDQYHYGFNGQMKVNEWAGVGNHYEFKYRGYDPRVARFGSIDPLTKQYPWYTPYQFAGNSPIKNIDIEGAEECSADAAQMRLQTGYLKGTVTEGQLRQQAQAQAAGATAGLVALFDIFVTKGKLSSYLWSSYLWGTQNHTESKNPTVAAKQRQETRDGTVSAVVGYGAGKLFGWGVGVATRQLGPVFSSTEAVVARGLSGRTFTQSGLSSMLKPAEDDAIVLYRGMTGSENGSGVLFMTTDEAYAASYSSDVASFRVSRSGFNALRNEDLIGTKNGINIANGAKGPEVVITDPAVKAEILKSQTPPPSSSSGGGGGN
jgi:RHS repeat-associated protein